MVAAKLATLGNGQRKDGARSNDLAQADAAALLQVSEPSVKRAKHVVERGKRELTPSYRRLQLSRKPEKLIQAAIIRPKLPKPIAHHGAQSKDTNPEWSRKAVNEFAKLAPVKEEERGRPRDLQSLRKQDVQRHATMNPCFITSPNRTR